MLAPAASLEALCEEAFWTVNTPGDGLVDLPGFKAVLRKVFHALGETVPQPDSAWFSKVFANYASKCGGRLNLKCVEDVARQYYVHHAKKSKERQLAQGVALAAKYTDGSPLHSVSPASPQGDKLELPPTREFPSTAAQVAAQVAQPKVVAGYPGAGDAHPGSAFHSLQLASQVMFPTNCERLAVFEQYEFGGALGEGSYGRVSTVTHRTTGQRKACKTIGVNSAKDRTVVETEINLLKQLDHPHIIRLSECFLDGRNMYLISELCEGGPLLEGFTRRGLDGWGGEVAAASCMRQILSAANYCHSKGIIHRDLKPSNVLYVSIRPASAVKVIDFGLSNFLERLSASASVEGTDQIRMQRAGTFLFMAPEILAAGHYDEKVDLWAIGCILFLLVTGVHPFCTRRMRSNEVRQRMASGCVLEHANWTAAPPKVRDLVTQMLTVHPARRVSAAEALQHSWFSSALKEGKITQPGKPSETSASLARVPSAGVPESVFECLKQYQAASKLKKAILRLLAKEVDEARIQHLREIFRKLDVHQHGFLARDELLGAMKEHLNLGDLTAVDLEMILPSRVGNCISSNEFVAALLVRQGWSRAELLNAFRRFDIRREGKISMGALSEVLKHAGSAPVLEEAFREADVGKDGYIDFEEFCALLNS